MRKKKKEKKLVRFFDKLGIGIIALLIILIATGMFKGGLKMLSYDFIKYLITISFILAGFTFFTFFDKQNAEFSYWIAQACWLFILSGFFFLANLSISNIGETSEKLFQFLITFNYLNAIMGLILFIVGLVTLILVLNNIINKMPFKPNFRKKKKFQKRKYEKIVKELVNASFPALKNKKIHIRKSIFSKYSASTKIDLFLGLSIWINPKYNIYNDFELKGLLAHELSHLEDWVIKGRWYRFVNKLRCFLSKDYLKKYEKATDRRAICKGYRKELKAQRKKRWSIKDKNLEKIKNNYLTPEEIERVVCK